MRVVQGQDAGAEWASFLSAASSLLSGSSDTDSALRALARAAVGAVADWCVVDVCEPDGSLRRLAVAHWDPATEARGRALARQHPVTAAQPVGPGKVARELRPQLIAEVPEALLEAAAQDREHLAALRALGLRSVIIVPLSARGRALGALTFMAAETARRYGPRDLSLAEGIAGLCALAVDNAELHREAQAAERRAEEANALVDSAFAQAPTGLAFLDRELRYLRVNEAIAEMNGIPAEAHLGRTPREVLSEMGADVQRLLKRVLETGEPLTDLDLNGETPAAPGIERNWLATFYPVRGRGDDPLGVAVLVSDVTERRRIEEQLRHSDERFRVLVEAVRDYAIFMLDPDGRVVSWNPGAEQITGYRAGEIVGERFSRLYSPEDIARDLPGQELRAATDEGRFEGEGWRLRRDGSLFWAHVLITRLDDEHGRVRGFANVTRDTTERKRFEDELAHRALHDPLTGLPNRSLFLDRVEHALARSRRHPWAVVVMFLDLDRFKVINDSLGHSAGDELLVAVAERLTETVRPGDTVARFGGDEFALLCEDVESERAAALIAERVTDALARPLLVAGEELAARASVGVVAARDDQSAEALLRDADTAMYRAKERGGGRHELFHPTMRARALERLEIERALRRALEEDGFYPVYQPIVALRSGKVAGVEALARWDHRRYGELGPAEFIPVAEETGLIGPLGAFMLREACREAARWTGIRTGRPPIVALNVSLSELADPHFPAAVKEALAAAAIAPSTLCLEVTDSAPLHDTPAATEALQRLATLGVQLAVDGFGTGHCSLDRLERLPLSFIKLDPSLIQGIDSNPRRAAIVGAVTDIAPAIDAKIIAEGIETAEQLATARQLGCDLAQGFHLHPPQRSETIRPLLRAKLRDMPCTRSHRPPRP